MKIEPNSEVRLLRGLKLDPLYSNTIYFNSSDSQSSFFDSMAKYRLNRFTYLRNEVGIRVNLNMKDVIDCNYIMFRNVGFENKWFYGFITDFRYLNAETTEILFNIDVIQSWMFELVLPKNYVVRESNGNPYSLESLEYGNIVCDSVSSTEFFTEYGVNVFASESFGSLYEPRFRGGIYEGAFSRFYPPSRFNDLHDILITASAKPETIVSLVYTPTSFYTTDGNSPVEQEFTVNKPTAIGSYTPKHSKLLRFPYVFLSVDCGNSTGTYKWEYFRTDNARFKLFGTTTTNPQIMCVPTAYNSTQYYNYTEKIIMSGFPQLSFNASSYNQWLANSGFNSVLGGVSSIAGSFGGGATGLISAGLGLASALNSSTVAATQGDTNRGSNDGNIEVATKSKNFYFKSMRITETYAEMIDFYLDRYGENTNKIKTPNISTGSHKYIQTKDCSVAGNIPSSYRSEIAEIFNKGVTFWASNDIIGSY